MKGDPPYLRFGDDDLILRDLLAADRTVLANERTLLAYVRTALGMFVAGVSFIQFFSAVAIQATGWVFCVVAIATVLLGAARYLKVKRSLARLRMAERTAPAEGTHSRFEASRNASANP